jgi:membrane protein
VRQQLQRLAHFAVRVWTRFHDDGCFALAASLTYTALLALVPLLTIALTLITAFPVFQEFMQGVDDFFAKNMLPPAVAKTVTGYVEKFTHSAAGLTAAGIAMLAVAAILLMLTIERAFNQIWRVTRPRPLAVRVLIYWGVLTLGPLLIGISLTITSYLVSASLGVARHVPGGGGFVLATTPVVLTAAAFTLVYLIVPNRPVRLAHAAIGGVAAAVLFEAMKRAFALYIAKFPTYALVYGAFAAVPIFLVWVYLSWVVTLLGAVIAALLPDYGVRRAAHGARDPGAVFRAALDILRVLVRAQRDAQTLDTRRVLGQAGVSTEIGEPVLDRLASRGWAARVVGQRWALTCDPDVVRLADVYEGLVFDAKRGRTGAPDATIDAILERAAAGAASALDAPLRTLAKEPPTG